MKPSHNIDQNYRELCAAVGHLFITFARLEGVMSSILKLHLANAVTDRPDVQAISVSSAIYGGMRFTAARDAIKRIAAAERVDHNVTNFALSLFSQIGHIQDFRDKIAHQTLIPASDGSGENWWVVDTITTREIRNSRAYVFDTSAVGFAAVDLITAADRLGGKPESGHILQALANNLLPINWLYRSSMLKSVPRTELKKLGNH